MSAQTNGQVTLQSTDLEVSLRSKLPQVSVEREGKSVVPGKLVTEIVRSLPEAAITLTVEGETASITCLQSSFTVKTMSPDDFPQFPEVATERPLSLPALSISNVVKHVSKAVSRDETRPVLTGVLLTIEGKRLKMVSTDSYRLAVKETIVESHAVEDTEVIVPGKVMEEVSRLAPEDEDIEIGISENQVVFSFGTTEFVTRRIEGSFPNYRQLIPKESETTVVLPRDDVLTAVKRVSLLAQHNTPLRVTISSDDQTLSLSAATHDVGDASEDLMANVEGQSVEIAFNHAFLLDGLLASEGDNVRISIVSPLKPGVITSPDDEDFLYLLMPVRLG